MNNLRALAGFLVARCGAAVTRLPFEPLLTNEGAG